MRALLWTRKKKKQTGFIHVKDEHPDSSESDRPRREPKVSLWLASQNDDPKLWVHQFQEKVEKKTGGKVFFLNNKKIEI